MGKTKNLKELLTNPFEGLKENNLTGFQAECKKIAGELFCNYCIKCGNKTFRFAEIEFYFYEKGKWQDKWNTATYYRDKNAGELFFHYSGVDICFQSYLEKDLKNKFGGILIRSLVEVDDKGNYVALHKGPLFCTNLMLNYCKEKMPFISDEVDPIDYNDNMIQADLRFGVDNESQEDEKNKNLQLCFFINQYKDAIWEWNGATETLSWDKKSGELKLSKRYYNRFKK